MRVTPFSEHCRGAGPACREYLRAAVRHPYARPAAVLAGLVLCLFWSYWPTFRGMEQRWSHDPQYSHGFLVPVFALVVLWFRRDRLPAGPFRPSWAAGLAVLGLALALRLAAAYFYLQPLDACSLLPALAGLILLLAGWPLLRWCWPAVAFLGFMLPLPFQVDQALAQPLRKWATLASTYCLQTLGLPALSEGNIILIDDLRLGVVEACSGLGMLVTFFALATALALVIDHRPVLDRVVVVVSAVPIAVVVNVARITLTAVAYRVLGQWAGDVITHDLAGWLMMPMALALLGLELWLLSKVLIEVEETRPVPVDLAGVVTPLPYPHRPGEPVACELYRPNPVAGPRRAPADRGPHDAPPPHVPRGR